MAMHYGTSRHNFNKVYEAYMSYVALYKLFNNGKILGITPFNVFYWRMTYLVKYENAENAHRMY